MTIVEDITDIEELRDENLHVTAEDVAESVLENVVEAVEADGSEAVIERDWEGGDVTAEDVAEHLRFKIDGRPSVRFTSISGTGRGLGSNFRSSEEVERKDGETVYRVVCSGCGGEGRVTVTHGWNCHFKCENCGTEQMKGG